MPDVVPAVAPDGTPGTVAAKDVPKLVQAGGQVVSPQEGERARAQAEAHTREAEEPITPGSVAKNYGETWLAGHAAGYRGLGEAFGVPIDALLPPEAKRYLRELEEKHPVVSGVTRVAGQARGALGAAELTGAAGLARGAGAAYGTAARIGAAGVVGGVENVVAATTSDINEAALGKADTNGEKLLAAMPKHFAVGFGVGALFEGGAAALEKVPWGRAAEAADRQASAAIGRETGEAGPGAIAAGERVRQAGGLPRDRQGLVDILESEQAALRKQETGAYGETVAGLRKGQRAEAEALAARHEAGRGAVAAERARGLEAAERGAAEGVLDTAARGGARVEAAELAGAARAKGAHGAAFEANVRAAEAEARAGGAAIHGTTAEAGQAVQATMDHYGAVRRGLQEERDKGAALAARLGSERDANAKEMAESLARLREGGHAPPGALTPSQFDEILDTYLGMMGRKGDPATRWAAEQQLREVYKAEIGSFASSSESTQAHIDRLKSMADDLEKAHAAALDHLKKVDGAIRKTETQAERDIAQAGRAADAKVSAYQKATTEEARKAGRAADEALARAKEVEASVASDIERARGIGQKEVKAAEKAGERKIVLARAESEAAAAKFEKITARDREALAKGHSAAEKAIPKPTGKTEVDPLLEGAISRGKELAGRPIVPSGAAIGAGFSLLHGNPLAAATALLSGFAANRARAEGNFLAARGLRAISERLSSVDMAIRRGAASLFGRAAAKEVLGAEREISAKPKEKKAPAPTFEDVSRRVLAARVNPTIVEAHVRQTLGADAEHAPDTYAATLGAAQRAQAFLHSVLPVPQRDPTSLTPGLHDPGVSDTEKDEFMRLFSVVDDPMHLFREVKDGTISPDQVAAVEGVYGKGLYQQMRAETLRHVMSLTKPLDYEREIAIGVFLGKDTNGVLGRDFQGAMAASYEDRGASSAPMGGSKPRSGALQLTKDIQSTSEKVSRGEM